MTADSRRGDRQPDAPAGEPHAPDTTFSRPYQAPMVRAGNALLRAVHRLAGPPRPFDADELMSAAQRRTGLHDFGDPAFEEPLRILAEGYNQDARLHPVGRRLIRGGVINHLARRLEIVEALRRDATLATRPVVRPLIVVGLPRTGTTLLYNLLAVNRFARPLLGWEGADPVGAPAPGRRDGRPRRYADGVRRLERLAPSARLVHELTPTGPEEDMSLLQRTFVSRGFPLRAGLPNYSRWLLDQPQSTFATAYEFHRAQLQVLQAQRPVPQDGHWVLKAPAHLHGLEGLLRTYPDACLVQTHRRLGDVVPSACSLVALIRSICSDSVDPVAIGREALYLTEQILQHVLDMRSRIPAERVIDVRYDDFTRDPITTLDRIHDHFGLKVDPAAASRARAYLADRPQHRHGAHRYSLAQFGISPEALDGHCRAYEEHFLAEPQS